jgi:hypothetical protein
MKKGKSVGPDNIPAELWKECGDMGQKWLCNLFNEILSGSPCQKALE